MSDVLGLEAIAEADAPRVGGKAASLAATLRTGLPVPPGFAVTTDAYWRSHSTGLRSDAKLADAICEAYRSLGGTVAVRSSATGEDGAEASFAGQQETFLGVVGEDAVLDAIERCWRSLHTERAVAYRKKQGIPDASIAMAVVVQRLVPADAAGVLFTRDPMEPTANRMIVEASYGLGEAVVSGKVTPDRFVLDIIGGELVEKHLGRKTVRVVGDLEEPVPEELQNGFCLSDADLKQLAELGRQVEAFFGQPRDIEWAIADGRVFLLQARPITTTTDDRETIRREIIAELKAKAAPRGTVWVRYNLSEILPRPTPMTWAIVQRLLAADGGIGRMNRDLGGDPDPALGSLTAFDLIAGRPMANLSRMPRLQFRNPPFEFPFREYKTNPRLALDPKPIANPLRDGFLLGLLRLPGTIWKLWRISSLTRARAAPFADEFESKIIPPFATEARAALARDFASIGSGELVAMVDAWTTKSLVDFARDSLKPTVFADAAWNELKQLVAAIPGVDDARATAMVGELAMGARPNSETDLASAIGDLASGRIDRSAFVEGFGHRAANEMELAAPRWSDRPDAIPVSAPTHGMSVPDAFERIAKEANWSGMMLARARATRDRLHRYLGLRETAKHWLLLGYAVIRKALLELDRRSSLGGGIFFLTPDELPALVSGADWNDRIAVRRRRWQTERTIEVPPVLFSDDLDAIGRAAPIPEGTRSFQGTPLSAGVAEGRALVLHEPSDAADFEDGFVLVCPSTDPAWVPLFARASALVMETGGVLSHGAIVAREFGLPAVAGLPEITRQVTTGKRLRVDGGTGTVAIVE
jgi:phosphohistidine swiveling domain-containing protein